MPIVSVVAVTLVAVGLGVAHAKSLSGNQLVSLVTQRGQTPSSTSQASPQPTSQTFQLTGGTVAVSCANGVITVAAVTPSAGFTVKEELEDQGGQLEIRFESSTHESRLEVKCEGNVIQVEELREEAIEEQAPPAQPAQTPAPSMTRTFNLVGGTVTVTCTGNTLTVDSAVPNPGFGIEQERQDGGTVAEFRFENDTHKSRLEVGCANGQIVVEELREESS